MEKNNSDNSNGNLEIQSEEIIQSIKMEDLDLNKVKLELFAAMNMAKESPEKAKQAMIIMVGGKQIINIASIKIQLLREVNKYKQLQQGPKIEKQNN